jgi:hypothetical protein
MPACHAGGREFEPHPGRHFADVAQLAEQLICNQQVGGSSPPVSSIRMSGEMPEWLKGADCKSVDLVYDGSNPSFPTIFIYDPLAQLVEHLTFNQGVRGSNPRWITIFR